MMEKCRICGREFKNVDGLLAHVSQRHRLKSKEYYDTYFKKENEGICPVCGKETNYKSFSMGYTKYCQCCVFKSDDVKDKIKKTNLDRWGTEHPSQSKYVKEKIKKTNMKKYGVDYPLKLSSIQEKITNTCTTKNGGRGYASQEILEKAESTCLERYNVRNYSLTDEYHDKVKSTSLQKYGKEYFLQTEEYLEKSKQTCLERYGVERASQSKEVQEKIKQNNLKRYGVESIFQLKSTKDKIKETNLEKYNVECVFQREDIQEKSHSKEAIEKCYKTKKKNNTFNTSKIENEIEIKLRGMFPDLKTQYKSEEYPFNCDYYIPELDLYIEYNGTWTHGGHFFDKNNLKDLEKLNQLTEKSKNSKFYRNAIETWTVRDILKLNTAIENNLNYIAWFNEEQAYDWIERIRHEKEKTEKTC